MIRLTDKDLNLLTGRMGLCYRAGQASFGEGKCLKTVRSGACGVLLVDNGASSATKEEYITACHQHDTPVYILPEDTILRATGKPGMAMAVSKGKMVDMLLAILSQAADVDGME